MNFDSPSYSSGSGGSGSGGDGVDPELQSFIQQQTQKAELQARVHQLHDICWERCMDKPKNKLDSRLESCMSNCVERFIDTSFFITKRIQQHSMGH